MKIFFTRCACINCGDTNEEMYDRLADYISRIDTVLSLSSESNYHQMTEMLKEADVVIAECTYPSLVVGYELSFAEKCMKPVHILHSSEIQLPAILAENPNFQIHPYKDEREVYSVIDNILFKLKEEKSLTIVDAISDDIIRLGDEVMVGSNYRYFITRIIRFGKMPQYVGFSEDGKESFTSNSNRDLKKTGRHTDEVLKLDKGAQDLDLNK